MARKSMYRKIQEAVYDIVRDARRPLDLSADIYPMVRDFMHHEYDAEMAEWYLLKTLMVSTSRIAVYPYMHEGRIRYAVTTESRIFDYFPSNEIHVPTDWWTKKKPRRR